MTDKYKWLEHLETSIPKEAHGYPISMYSIALEGWRRGLSLKFRNNFRVKAVTPFILSGYGKDVEFMGTRSQFVSRQAIRICMNKEKTKEFLEKVDVKVPKGNYFHNEDNRTLIKYANKLGFPLVIKPTNASGGRGVIANIASEDEFKEALNYVKNKLGYNRLIIEEFIKGEDYRVYVVGDKAIAAYKRIPANVIGDGISTIRQLFTERANKRRNNPGIFNQNISLDNETKNLLKSQGFTLSSVPELDETVFLKTTGNVATGGESVDTTDILPSFVKDEVIKAVRAIPGLLQAGVDVLYDEETKDYAIIEINTQPSLRGHLFPMWGKARDIPKAIIDYYFPESKENSYHENPLYYFDIKTVYSSFRFYTTEGISIPSIPTGDILIRKYKLTFNTLMRRNSNWFQKRAKEFRLNGYLKFADNNQLIIFCSGPNKSINKFDQVIKTKATKRYRIKSVAEKEIEIEKCTPIKVGFEIIDENNVIMDDVNHMYMGSALLISSKN